MLQLGTRLFSEKNLVRSTHPDSSHGVAHNDFKFFKYLLHTYPGANEYDLGCKGHGFEYDQGLFFLKTCFSSIFELIFV